MKKIGINKEKRYFCNRKMRKYAKILSKTLKSHDYSTK